MSTIGDNKDTLKFAGDFQLDVCTLISYRKSAEAQDQAVRVNILPQVLTISYVEDITLQCISGEIVLSDVQDIRTSLPLTGMERLELKFYTPGSGQGDRVEALEETSDPYYVYKIEKVRPSGGTGRQQVYKLHFTSREAYRNSIFRVSQSFTGPVEDAVLKIVKSPDYLDSRKPLYVEETKTNSKYVIPNKKPFNAIKFLSSEAISLNYNNSNYLFFETMSGFHFRSIESLMALGGHTARPVKEKYHLQPARVRSVGERDVEKDMRGIISYSFEDPVNQLRNMNNGLFASRVIEHDMFKKTIVEKDFDYHTSFVNYFHTEHSNGAKTGIKFIQPYAYFDNTKKLFSEHPLQRLMLTTSTSEIHDNVVSPSKSELIQNSQSQRQQLLNNNLILNVPGNTKLHAGDMISFSLPYSKPVGPNEKQELNPYFAGRYLVLQVKHLLSRENGKHDMVLRCAKDSVYSTLPVETDTDVVKLKDKKNKDIITVYEKDETEIETASKQIGTANNDIFT
jgi:hypothetical protein